jgi:hypothetical protein
VRQPSAVRPRDQRTQVRPRIIMCVDTVFPTANAFMLRPMAPDRWQRLRARVAGSTWGPIVFDPALISPVCAGSIIRAGDVVYFANPASSTGRQNGVIRRSADGVTWSKTTRSVFTGAYGYSCLTLVPKQHEIGLLWESDGPQCRPGGASCRTLFSTYPRF